LSFQRCSLPALWRSPWAKNRNEMIRAGVLQFFIVARFGNLARIIREDIASAQSLVRSGL
jgi:hypothetical protein